MEVIRSSVMLHGSEVGEALGEVLVTGASGRLGRSLIPLLQSMGYTVRALAQRKEGIISLPQGILPYFGDLCDRKALRDACDGVQSVYHLASIVSQHKAKPENILRVNVEGTKCVIDAAEAAGAGRFFFSSTVDVYGSKRHGVLTESSETRPNDMYGESKLLAEREIAEHGSMRNAIFRIAAIYGPGFEGSFFKVMRAIKSGKILVIGSGTNVLALVHVRDLLEAFRLATASDKALGVYNIADGESHTQEELLRKAAEMIGASPPASHAPEPLVRILAKRRGLDSDELRFITSNRQIDISKARKELGFRPVIGIDNGGKELARLFLSSTHG